MKNKILFNLFFALFAFVTFSGDVHAETIKECDYNTPLASFECKDNLKFKIDYANSTGVHCQVGVYAVSKNKETVTVTNAGAGTENCNTSKFIVKNMGQNICNVYGGCKDEHGAKVCDYTTPVASFACAEGQGFNVQLAHSAGTECHLELYDAYSTEKNVTIQNVGAGTENCNTSKFTVQNSGQNTCHIYGCTTTVIVEDDYSDNGVMYNTCTISCGNVKGIPENLPVFVRRLVNIVKILIPIILIIMGIVDFLKAMTSGDEKSMSETPRKFVRRIIVAVVIFLIVTVIQFVIRLVSNASLESDSDKNPAGGIAECISCFVSDKKSCGEVVCK